MKKALFVCSLLGLFSVKAAFEGPMIGDKRHEYALLAIQAIQNRSKGKVFISATQRNEIVAESSKVALSSAITIPFVSLGSYTLEYAQNIPYAPKKALRIKTIQGLFRLWQNEKGVICAPDPEKHELGSEWKTQTLLPVEQSPLLLKLLLLISKKGEVQVKQVEHA